MADSVHLAPLPLELGSTGPIGLGSGVDTELFGIAGPAVSHLPLLTPRCSSSWQMAPTSH